MVSAQIGGMIVSTSPPKHEGVAKSASGRSLVRISTSLKFTDAFTGLVVEENCETYVLVNSNGDLERGTFSEVDAYARLASLEAGELERKSFEVKPLFSENPRENPIRVHKKGKAANLFSGVGKLNPLPHVKEAADILFVRFGLQASSGSGLKFFPNRQAAEAKLKELDSKPSVRPHVRRSPH